MMGNVWWFHWGTAQRKMSLSSSPVRYQCPYPTQADVCPWLRGWGCEWGWKPESLAQVLNSAVCSPPLCSVGRTEFSAWDQQCWHRCLPLPYPTLMLFIFCTFLWNHVPAFVTLINLSFYISNVPSMGCSSQCGGGCVTTGNHSAESCFSSSSSTDITLTSCANHLCIHLFMISDRSVWNKN